MEIFMKKRILTAFLVIVYTFSCFAAAVNADTAEGTEVKESDARFDYVIDVYEELGIFQRNLSLFDGETVTRADAAKLLYGMINAVSVPTDGRHYIDVKQSHSAYAEIEAVSTLKLMAGDENGSFNPDRAITVNEAVKTMVCALGYKELADFNGGYPAGYMMMASKKKLLKGMNELSGNAEITGRDLAVLMYNTLRSEVMEGYSFAYADGESVQYKTEREEELLEIRHDIIVEKGIIEGTETANIYGDEECAEGEVLFGGELYKYTAADIKLGYKADAYIKDVDGDGDPDTVICFAYEEGYNRATVIDAEELNGYSAPEYSYGVNKKIRISDSTQVLYNGKHMSKYDESLMVPEYGYIELISNDGGSTYNVLFIHDQITVVVAKRSLASKAVIDRYDSKKTVVLDETDDTVDILITDGDKKITVEEITEDNVLTVEKSQDGTCIRVFRSKNSVTGTVKSITNNKTVKIDDASYSVFSGVIAAANITAGKEYTFLLDINGRIAGTSDVKDKWLYAIVLNSKPTTGLDNKLNIKVFTTGELEETLSCAEKVVLDGRKISSTQTSEISDENVISARIKAQDVSLIRYKLNADGEINYIDTLYKDTGDNVSDTLFRMTDRQSRAYNASYYTFGGKINVGSGTTIYQINPVLTGETTEDYRVVAANSITGNKAYEVESFADDADAITPSIIMMYYAGGATGIGYTAKYMVVESVGTSMAADGTEYACITGIWNGWSQTVLVKDTLDISGLNEGDIIRFGQNNDNYVKALEKVYDAETGELGYGSNPYGDTTNNGGADFFAALANVWRCKDGHMVTTYDDGYKSEVWPEEAYIWKLGNAPVYIYEKNSRGTYNVTVGSQDDIIGYDQSPSETSKVLLNVHWYGVTEVWVIK